MDKNQAEPLDGEALLVRMWNCVEQEEDGVEARIRPNCEGRAVMLKASRTT